ANQPTLSELQTHDVVITTYDVLRAEVNYSKELSYGLRAVKRFGCVCLSVMHALIQTVTHVSFACARACSC
ncbi:MAG TPA: hypothetical protein V6C97_00655, partial [Oculatellaceae cyanobacterium]